MQDKQKKSVEQVYSEWILNLHIKHNLYGNPILTSGIPVVDRSDVDVNVLVADEKDFDIICADVNAIMRSTLTWNILIKDHREKGWITVSFLGLDREVNVRYTIHWDQILRTLQHRNNELILSVKYPKLALKVASLKVNGDGTKNMSTEPAWAKVLELECSKDEAYDRMEGPTNLLLEAAKKVSGNN